MSPVSRHIAMLVYDGVRTLDVTGAPPGVGVVPALRGEYTNELYAVTDAAMVCCSSGMRLAAAPITALANSPDTLLVPGGECLVTSGPDPRLLAAVRRIFSPARRT